MAEFNQEEFNQLVIENDVVGFWPEGRTLKSGRFSHWYANCRVLTDRAGIAKKTASYVISFVQEKGLDFDYFYGVPAGVTKLAGSIAGIMGTENPDYPYVIGREKPKEHGDPKDKYFIGPMAAGDRVVVIEDVTTTGGSMLKTLDQLAEAGVEVVGVVALVNRMEKNDDGRTVAELVAEKGTVYYSMSDADQLIPMAIKKYAPSTEFLKNFQEKYNEVAIKPIDVLVN